MSCIVSQKDIKNRLRNQVKDKFDSALFYSYTDRLVAFIPYDAANPSKNVLYGKVKKIESQLNKEYGADTYGNVVSFEQKPSGVEISIHPTAQLADAMTNQNIRDEVGDDYYMGDEALKEQETQEYNFSKRETYATKKELQKIFQGNGIVKHGKAIQDAISHIRTNENPTVELQKQNKRDSKQIRLDEDEALRAYINSNNLWYEKEFNEENEFIGDNMEQIVYLDPESHSVIKLNSTRFYNSWHEYFNSLLLQNYFFPQTSYELLGFKEVDGLLHSVVKQPFVYGNDSTSLSHIRQFMQFNDFTRVSEFRINDYENKEMGIIIGDLHDDNVFTLDDDLLFIDTVFEVKDKFYEEVPKLDDLNFSARESQIGKRPLTDNYIEYRNYKKAQLDKTKRLLANLNREKRNPRKNASAILAQIKKLNITEANLKQDLESLESNEVELMFHALKSDIKNLNDILDNVDNLNSNYDLGEIRNNLDFLYSFVKGVDLDNNQTDLESLKAFNHPGFAEISLSVDDLNIKYQDTLAEIRDSIIKEDISYINNIENNETITEEDLANMFNSKEDLNWMELNLIGITGASKDDGILPQILKSFLETKVALREAEVKTYQDELNSLVEKLKPGGFDFIFEKTYQHIASRCGKTF